MLFDSDDFKVIRTKYWDIHQDWEVPIPGFFIVALNREGVKSVGDLAMEEWMELGELLKRLRQGMKEVLGINEVYLFQNEDSSHGFHLWVFPRLPWMEEFGRKIESVRPIINYAKENMVTEEIRKQVKDWVDRMREWMQKQTL